MLIMASAERMNSFRLWHLLEEGRGSAGREMMGDFDAKRWPEPSGMLEVGSR